MQSPENAAEHSSHPTPGRLFFSPEQRREIEHQYLKNIARSKETQASPEIQSVNGIALSRSGRRTVWINGKAREEAPPPASSSLLTAGVSGNPGAASEVRIKAGERLSYDPERREHRIDSPLGSGTISVRDSATDSAADSAADSR